MKMAPVPYGQTVLDNPHDSETLEDYLILLKPRVMSLVVFTGLCGLLMAPGHIHPVIAFTAILCISVAAGAAGCLNMWYDRDIDAKMSRTKNRPLPQNRIHPNNALTFGVILSFASVFVMGVGVNWIAAFWLFVTIFFYVFIYSIWLKRRTPQNIVIGGASGAFPPLIGWVCVTKEASFEAWLLFAIIFLWTPAHFWALALYRQDDYRQANIPMLPVVYGEKTTKRQIVYYSVLLFLSTLVPWIVGMSSIWYLSAAVLLGTIFVLLAFVLLWEGTKSRAMRLFAYSIVYLFFLFLTLTVDRMYVYG